MSCTNMEYGGLTICGSTSFLEHTRQALDLILPTLAFQTVRAYIAEIREARQSGMSPWGARPRYNVGRATWESPVIWYASTIAHDACHSKLYWNNQRSLLGFHYTPCRAWTGKAAEIQCLALQLKALQEMNADQKIQDYVASLMTNPSYQDQWFRDW